LETDLECWIDQKGIREEGKLMKPERERERVKGFGFGWFCNKQW